MSKKCHDIGNSRIAYLSWYN